MSERHTFPLPQMKGNKGVHEQSALPVSNAHRGPIPRSIYRRVWLLLGRTLLGIVALMILSYLSFARLGKAPAKEIIPTSASADGGLVREYALRKGSEAMRPAIDHQGRSWLGDFLYARFAISLRTP